MLFLSFLLLPLAALGAPPLYINSETQSFKIMQLTDLHYGERYGNGSYAKWGTEQDLETSALITMLLEVEQPDLVVLTGDLLTGNNIYTNATAYWREIVKNIAAFKSIDWLALFGNHDDMAMEWNASSKSHELWRYQLMQYDSVNWSDYSHSQLGPSDLFGVSNYVTPIFYKTDDNLKSNESKPQSNNENDSRDNVAFWIYALDSGGGSLPEQVTDGQVDWLKNAMVSNIQGKAGEWPVFILQHIPFVEFESDWDFNNHQQCYGDHNDSVGGLIAAQYEFDTLYDLSKEYQLTAAQSRPMIVGVGHNHGNDYCCLTKNVNLCYGRHSSYSGYGDQWIHGARVYQMTWKNLENLSGLSLRTWIRLADFSVISNITIV